MHYKQYMALRDYLKMKDRSSYKRPRRQYKYLYRKMHDEKTIRKAWKNLRKGKTKREAVKRIEANMDKEVEKMRLKILNTKPDGYEVEHPELAYKPPVKRKVKIVNERGKERIAYLAEIREQWYFHIIVEVLKPIVLKRMYKYSCGSIPGRGPHSGKDHIERAIRKGKNIRYFMKLDIRHFYDNLSINIVIMELKRDIADELFLYCIYVIYIYMPKGIMIGLFISPWLANYVLIDLDGIIVSAEGTNAPTRYMDDITVFANSKKVLVNLLPIIKMELGRLRLRLKRNFQICKFDYETKRTKITKSGKVIKIRIGRPLDFMGFVFFRDRTVIRKNILLHVTREVRKLKKAKDKGRRYYAKKIRGVVSSMGWFKYTDSYDCYLMCIKPYVNIGKLKKIISKLDKEEHQNERLERGTLLRTAA